MTPLLILFLCSPLPGTPAVASWYGPGFHGRLTAGGLPYDQYGMTCAHRTLPLGTVLEVQHNGRTVIVRVCDRGPYVAGRDLDLSLAAAKRLRMIREGVATVYVRELCRKVGDLRYNTGVAPAPEAGYNQEQEVDG
jgi:rare lipoprotein A